MNRIDTETIKKIQNSLDIVDVISNYIPLVSRGKNHFGVCPFHDDTNPSMSVSKEKQIYTCFSCGASGNVIKFIMDYENISFLESLKKCADIANVALNISIGQTVKSKNNILYDIYEISSKFYQNNLNSTMGKNAKEYLVKRGINDEAIKQFQIGYSFKKRNLLTEFLEKKGYSKKDLKESGLVLEKEGLFDIYSNRIMFPIKDINGNVIAFSGRIFDSDDASKYINSKESEIFKKSEILYNIDIAKNYARQLGKIIIVEGFFDVIALYMADIKYAVATMGTAITKEHAALIKKTAKEVILCFDGDSAGMKATLNCILELSKVNVEAKIIILEDNMDPDEYLKKHGKEKLQERFNNTIGILDFKLQYLKQGKNLSNTNDMAEYVNQMINEINMTTNDIEREIAITKLSQDASLDINFIKNKINKSDKKVTFKKEIKKEESVYIKAQKHLIYYMLNDKDIIKIYNKNITFMPDEKCRLLAREIVIFYKENGYIDISEFMNWVIENDGLTKLLGEILSLNLKENYHIDEINKLIDTINDCNKKKHFEILRKKANETMDAKYLDEILKIRKGEYNDR